MGLVIFGICLLDNKSWFCLVPPLTTAPKLSFWLLAVVEHITLVDLIFCHSFMPVRPISLPIKSPPPPYGSACLWEAWINTFWLCFWGNQGSTVGRNEVSKTFPNTSGRSPKTEPKVQTCRGHSTWCFSWNVWKLWLKWIFLFAVPLWPFQTALWSGACWRTRRLDEPSWWAAVCTCSSSFRESTPSCE